MKRKIFLYLFAIFMLFNIGAATAMLYIIDTTKELNSIIKLHQVEQLRRSLLINIQTVQSQFYRMDTPFAQSLDSIVNSTLKLEESASKCSTCHHPPAINNRIIEMRGLLEDYKNHLSLYITGRANKERMKRLQVASANLGSDIITKIGDMSHKSSEHLETLTVKSNKNIVQVQKILIITVVTTIFLGIFLALKLIKSITSPLKELLNATRVIEAGNYGTTIDYADTTEIGELAENFNSMSIALKNKNESLRKEISESRLKEEALRESEEKLKSIFNKLPDIFFRTDLQGLITWVTPTAAKILLYDSSDDLIGFDFKKLFPNNEKTTRFLEELSLNRKVTDFEIEMLRSDKSTTLVNATFHYYYNKRGEVAGLEGFCRDITEHKKREEERQKIQKLESIGVMAGGIAHDFNNILTTITLNIELAKLAFSQDRNVSELLRDAEKACTHAKSLTSQLLTFSKGGEPIKKIITIENLIQDAANFALRGSKVKCKFIIQENLWPVEVDPGQLTQAFNNIVINAVQAMPNSGIIEVSAENQPADTKNESPSGARDFVKISFTDHGTGIPKESITKIFDPYFTTKQKGSGLGLWSTFSIIKNHNGYMNVESELGRGTTFTIYLPSTKAALPKEEVRAPDTFKKTGKILVMEDEDMIRESLGRLLNTLGYEVETAREGVEAIDLYTRHKAGSRPFDIVIMDLTISGGLGGRETIKKLLSIDANVKVIASSGYSHDMIMSDYEKYGFCGILTKPFKIENLSEILDKVMT